jgi:hypothetical protein
MHLHVISFDVPFPANYGGVIDVYYKLVWLHKFGVKIHLHCFTYGRLPSPELMKVCETVNYYRRRTGILSNCSFLPYTVASRRSQELAANLLADNYPVLFEVLHTCALLKDERFSDRKKIYRHSNIEHDYYLELSRSERKLVKRWYLKFESVRLKWFESIVKYADLILAVNKKDVLYFQNQFPSVTSVYLPSFHQNDEVSVLPGKGDYILFHGNLSISENYEAAVWLVSNVFSKIRYRVIIAGLHPPNFLDELMKEYPHIDLVASPPEAEMDRLVHNAHVHVLFTAQPTGLKLKLLNVLFSGRFVICNSHMLSGTGLSGNGSLVVAEDPGAFVDSINEAMVTEFTNGMKRERESLVSPFDNGRNAQALIDLIFGNLKQAPAAP